MDPSQNPAFSSLYYTRSLNPWDWHFGVNHAKANILILFTLPCFPGLPGFHVFPFGSSNCAIR